MATIAQNLAALQQAKSDIATAITTKGGTVTSGDGLSDFATDIGTIPTGVDTSQDTVTAEVLGQGYTAHNSAGQQIVGTAQIAPTPITSWRQLQQKVRNNDMDDISISDLFVCRCENMALVWEVIGKNQDVPTDPNYTYSLTLRLHDQLPDAKQFDAPEAFYYCSSRLSTGYYTITTSSNVPYYFKLTKAVPAGGQLVFYNRSNSQVASYSSATSTTPIETVSATAFTTGGTNLGVLQADVKSGNLNTYNRAIYGNNNWEQSGFRQWLNSNQTAGNWWTPKNNWDRPPDYASTLNGFLYDLDPEFVEVLGLTNKITTYTSADGIGTYTTNDLMFLLSQTEVYGGDRQSGYPEGQAYTFYSEGSSLSAPGTGADTNRITYRSGTASIYWLRTPTPSDSYYVYGVNSNGSVNYYDYGYNTAYLTRGVLPACCII